MDVHFKKSDQTGDAARVYFCFEEQGLPPGAVTADETSGGHLAKAASIAKFEGKSGQYCEVLAPNGHEAPRIALIGLGKDGELDGLSAQKAGASAVQKLGKNAETIDFVVGGLSAPKVDGNALAAALALGAVLAGYSFTRYRTKEQESALITKEIRVLSDTPGDAETAFAAGRAIGAGVYVARDLVNAPANDLTPPAFADKAAELATLGVEINVLDEAQLESIGMGALLGVARGSAHPARVVTMHWQGGGRDKPLALVGKGVTFDTGGISLKPPGGMEDMKGDMGGAAAVVGAMHAIAARKAKANVVGLIGLVENMPDGTAQRPGDIVTTLSGQTVEVINTDAEGRLVLADVLWYAQQTYEPEAIIDLATLTGAIIISLGHEHAGLFSDDEGLAEKILAAGLTSGETVWRQPMGKAYEKGLKSKFADMKNVGGRAAGSVTAAHFLRRFTNDVPWAHLDIAGTAWKPETTALDPSWGTGFGVRLLDRLVAQAYETDG
ncbi:MAG: leucyl aminopeptidase [Pseudomonadota bacterium]